jgi:threonine aldolase
VQKQGEQAVAKSKAELNREITRRAIDMREKQREAKREKKRLIEAQAKADRSERLRREKEDIQQEMARQIAELYRREVDARTKEPTSIIKSKYQVPRLP